ncbi:hypothetical protein [Streptomyces celluloflavus]|uniref:hypothetical protein n=1 Tax=Streptomyces celluloflavus TaxID=58344 RepID=UPI00367BBA49
MLSFLDTAYDDALPAEPPVSAPLLEDIWTRNDARTLCRYRATGCTEPGHHLRLHANHRTAAEEPGRAIGSPRPGPRPMAAFAYAPLADEARLRRAFRLVCVPALRPWRSESMPRPARGRKIPWRSPLRPGTITA